VRQRPPIILLFVFLFIGIVGLLLKFSSDLKVIRAGEDVNLWLGLFTIQNNDR
jgi:hypothetical protein